jgi:dihydrofolate reductase
MNTQRKVILYIAMSLDGYIAKQDDDISFLSAVEQKGQDYGYAEFVKTIDTVIWGRKTYDKVLSFGIPYPYPDKKIIVLTRSPKPDKRNVTFYSGDLKELIDNLNKQNGRNIYIDGGAEIVNELLKLNLIDEMIISVIPVLLGSGITLFQQNRSENVLALINSTQYEKGLVQLHYQVEKGKKQL